MYKLLSFGGDGWGDKVGGEEAGKLPSLLGTIFAYKLWSYNGRTSPQTHPTPPQAFILWQENKRTPSCSCFLMLNHKLPINHMDNQKHCRLTVV